MKMQILLLGSFILSIAFAKADGQDLQKVLSKIHKAPLVTFKVEKKTKSELLGKEITSPGIIYVSSNKFRWDTGGDERSQIIYDGQTIWTIQEPPKEFKAPPQITKMKLDAKSESQVFLNRLFQENFKTQFRLTKKTQSESFWNYYLQPIQKNLGVAELIIKVNEKDELKEIMYVDEIQNKITISISKTTISKKENLKLFKFKPPTGTQVNEL